MLFVCCFSSYADSKLESYCATNVSVNDFTISSYNEVKNTFDLSFSLKNDGNEHIFIGDMVIWFYNNETGESTRGTSFPVNQKIYFEVELCFHFEENATYFPMVKDMSVWEPKYEINYRTCHFIKK